MSPRDKHAPNTLENYLLLHEKHLREREHFVIENDLSISIPAGPRHLRIEGVLRCRGNTFLKVDKILRFVSDTWVETIRYAYHGGVSFPEDHAIFRFDNAHGVHEQHVFDPLTGEELGSPRLLTRDQWPHLSECLDLLEAWCYDYGRCREEDLRKDRVTSIPDPR